jgi:hypothetical protein
VLVPALSFELGDRIWWPSRLSRGVRETPPAGVAAGRARTPAGLESQG